MWKNSAEKIDAVFLHFYKIFEARPDGRQAPLAYGAGKFSTLSFSREKGGDARLTLNFS